jgi:P-type Ca2+ transporter type 2C
MPKVLPHSAPIKDVLQAMRANLGVGLTEKEVRERLLKFGENSIKRVKRFRLLKIIFAQLASPLVLVLLIAGAGTIFLEEYLDAIVILIALLVSVSVGSLQEGRASNVFEKLAQSQQKNAIVLRDRNKMVIPVDNVVPGDIVYLEGGKAVPADIRLIEATNLSINEAALTGEWVAVPKEIAESKIDAPINEQKNIAWKGTIVAEGFGSGVVVATGLKTQIGKIADDTQEISQHSTPLQRSVRSLAKLLMVAIGIGIFSIIILGLLRGEVFAEMLLVAIAVAVAAMPTGLPAAVTVVLAVAMEAILKKGGLVKNLLAAETLGSTTVILTDKTGTLTEGKMSVAGLYTARAIGVHDNTIEHKDNRELLTSAILASDAFFEKTKDGVKVHGRPIEIAIVSAGLESGISQIDLFARGFNRIDFLQFESARRFSASLNNYDGQKRIYFSGAPELLLDLSEKCYAAGGTKVLDEDTKKEFQNIQKAESAMGHRFTAVAFRIEKDDKISSDIRDSAHPKGLIFVGLISFSDQVRPDVANEIQAAKNAGMRVVMVTGDHPETAQSIANRVGISKEGDKAVTGREVEDMNDSELLNAIHTRPIFSRMLPKQKLRIARALRSGGEVVAMTGDGVNDAPALVSADIGVAVGSGTDVAKEAADLIIIDNTFSTITAAIKEGRRAVDNLQKIVAYLLSTSFSEIIVIGGALAVGAPLPLLPAQILWANLIEEGLMSFPFAFEPAQKDIMTRPPHKKATGKSSRLVLTSDMQKIMLIVTVVTGVLLLGLFFWMRSVGIAIEEIRTVMFVALSLDSIFFALSFKDLKRPIWKISLTNNKLLFGALSVSMLLLIAAVTFPPLKTLLSLTSLTGFEVILLAVLGFVNLLTIEITKHWIGKYR